MRKKLFNYMIHLVDNLYESFSSSPQMENLWDFYLDDWSTTKYNISRFKVISTSVPQLTLEYDSHNTGNKYYSGYTLPSTFDLVLREDTKFSVYNYFKAWEREIFDDKTGQFISNDKEKTKQGFLEFKKFSIDMNNKKLLQRFAIDKAQTLLNNVTNTAFVQVQNVANALPGAAMPYGRQFMKNSIKKTNISLQPSIGDLFKEETTKSFYYHNVRYLGISDITTSYEAGGELQLTVKFAVDTVTDNLGE